MIEVGDFIDGNYEGKTTRELTERLSELEAQLERATDLVRHMRSELHSAELISDEEYAALAADSDNGQRVARLEGYDKIRKDLAEAKKAAEWTRIDAEHLPQVGDELFDYDEGGNVVESFHIACEAYHGKMHMQDETAGRLLKDGYTHYRPISAPTEPAHGEAK